MPTLNIQLDDYLIHRVKAVSEQTGMSLSELFAE